MREQLLEREGDSLDPLLGIVSQQQILRGEPLLLSLSSVERGSPPLLCLPNPETLLLPELGPSMAPEDHYRRLVSALSEASTFEDPQRLYHLGLPSHGMLPHPRASWVSTMCFGLALSC